eukprot:m.202767 g.202767  ORF g.202767 m.202767 type:complete len:323 (+) comp13724_c0_seq5:48-1016(+)
MAFDGNTYRKVSKDHSVKLTLLLLVLCVLAVSLTHWSTGTATINGISGDVRFGLFRACGDVSGENIFNTGIGSGDCRYGHCIESFFITPRATADSHDLCGRAKSTAAFVLISVGLFLVMSYYLLVRPFTTSTDTAYGFSFFLSIITVLTTLISWAVWIGWQSSFNGDSQRAAPATSISFSSLDLGACSVLMIIVTIIAAINTWMLSRRYREAVQEEIKNRGRRKTTRRSAYEESTMEPLNSGRDVDVENGRKRFSDDDDDDEEEEEHVVTPSQLKEIKKQKSSESVKDTQPQEVEENEQEGEQGGEGDAVHKEKSGGCCVIL